MQVTSDQGVGGSDRSGSVQMRLTLRAKPRFFHYPLVTIPYPLPVQLAFFSTASATLFGTSRYLENSIVKVARPWLIERTEVA